MTMKTTATTSWPHTETDPQRIDILAAADRLLAGTPTRSTGNLSIVQLAAEAGIKYWIIAQKHTDLRDHFKQLVAHARRAPATPSRDSTDAVLQLRSDHHELRAYCSSLEQLLQDYARIINELTMENDALRGQINLPRATVTPIKT